MDKILNYPRMSDELITELLSSIDIIKKDILNVSDKKKNAAIKKKMKHFYIVLSKLRQNDRERSLFLNEYIKNMIEFNKMKKINASLRQKNIRSVPWDIGHSKEIDVQTKLIKKRRKKNK